MSTAPTRRAWLLLACLACLAAAAVAGDLSPMAPDVIIVGDTGMVPARAIAELSGATIGFDAATNRATVSRGGTAIISYAVGSRAATRGGKPVTLPAAPVERWGTTYVPVRALVEALGGTLAIGDKGATMTATMPGLREPLVMAVAGIYKRDSLSALRAMDLYSMALDGSDRRRLTYQDSAWNISLPTFSPDGRRVVYANRGDVYIRDIDSPNERRIVDVSLPSVCESPQFIDGGTAVVYTRRKDDGQMGVTVAERQPFCTVWWRRTYTVYRVSVDGTGDRSIAYGGPAVASPDGTRIAFPSYDGVHVTDTSGTQVARHRESRSPVFSPDGKSIALQYESWGRLRQMVYPLSVLPVTRDDMPHAAGGDRTSDEQDACFSPDGGRVAYTSGGICTMDPRHEQVQELTFGNDMRPTFTPDGRRILFLRRGRLMSVAVDGGDLRTLVADTPVWDYRLSPDGTRVYFLAQPGVAAEADTTDEMRETDPAYTQADADAWMREVLPQVEKIAGRTFAKAPRCALVSRNAILPSIAREFLPVLATLRDTITPAELKAEMGPVLEAVAAGRLAACSIDGGTIYLVPGALRPVMRRAKVPDAYAPTLMRLCIAHELTHALQHQETRGGLYGWPETYDRAVSRAGTREGHAWHVVRGMAAALDPTDDGRQFLNVILGETRGAVAAAPDAPGMVTGLRMLVMAETLGVHFIRWHEEHGGAEQVWNVLASPPVRSGFLVDPATYRKDAQPMPKLSPPAYRLYNLPKGWSATALDVGELVLRTKLMEADPAIRDPLVQHIEAGVEVFGISDTSRATASVFAVRDAATAPAVLEALARRTQETIAAYRARPGITVTSVTEKAIRLHDPYATPATLTLVKLTTPKGTATLTSIRAVRGQLVADALFHGMGLSDYQQALFVGEIIDEAEMALKRE